MTRLQSTIAVACFARALWRLSSARAVGNPAEDLLKKSGLKPAGSLYALELDAEN
jgi:hypothetical protein